MAKKIYTKKLTYAGMSLCLLSFFAFILSAAGALADPVGKLVYNNVFTNKIDFLFTPDIFAYVMRTRHIQPCGVFHICKSKGQEKA